MSRLMAKPTKITVPSEDQIGHHQVAKDPRFLHADSKDSDQPGHHWVGKDPRFLHADSKYSVQTGRIPRLI